MKQLVEVDDVRFELPSIEGTIDEVIERLRKAEEDVLDIYPEAKEVFIKATYGWDETYYELWIRREETDEEYANRLKKEEKAKAKAEKRKADQIEKDRKEYERLKVKLGIK